LSAYVSQITNQFQIKQSFWRCLPYQLVIVDDESREILVVDHNVIIICHMNCFRWI
jgi:hypothetical protein